MAHAQDRQSGPEAAAAPPSESPAPPPLTLGELLDMPVSVASERDERISNASASITAYGDEDIRAYGAATIFDLANITAGYSGTVMYGERVLETRGQKAGSFNNNKHLVYFDGIPINHARNFKAPIDHELPLYGARRVEFLRGPASALYGTSAFFGAINVVPKQLSRSGMQAEARFGGGSRDDELRVSGQALYADDDRNVRLTLGYYDKKASRAFVGPTDDPDNLYWDDQKSVFLNASYQLRAASALTGTTVGFLYLRRQGGLGESWNENGTTHEINALTWETIIPYVKYERDFAQHLSLRAYLLNNTGREGGTFVPLTAGQIKGGYQGNGSVLEVYDTQTDAVLGKAELEWRFGPGADLIAGVTFDTRRERGADRSHDYMVSADPGAPYLPGPGFATPSDRHTIYSGYVQLQQSLPVLRGLLLTLGARNDYGTSKGQSFNELSPRIGVIQRLTDAFIMRAFFGTALRAPGIKEIGLNQEARAEFAAKGQPLDRSLDLRAETIRSLEFGPGYFSDHVAATLTLFSNRTINALDGVQYGVLNIFENSEGETDAKGLEAELQVAPSRQLRFFLNESWARARDSQGQDVEDVPIAHTTFGGIFQIPTLGLTFGANARYVRGFRVKAGKDLVSNAVLGNLNAIWKAGRALSLEIAVQNLFASRDKLPKHGVPDVPQPGFSVLGTIACGF